MNNSFLRDSPFLYSQHIIILYISPIIQIILNLTNYGILHQVHYTYITVTVYLGGNKRGPSEITLGNLPNQSAMSLSNLLQFPRPPVPNTFRKCFLTPTCPIRNFYYQIGSIKSFLPQMSQMNIPHLSCLLSPQG